MAREHEQRHLATVQLLDEIAERVLQVHALTMDDSHGGASCPFPDPTVDMLYRVLSVRAGWDPREYSRLYSAFIESTRDSFSGSSKAKGDRLEELVRHLLEKSGFAKDVRELTRHAHWQVDGQGMLRSEVLAFMMSPLQVKQIGPQVFVECKNHSTPMGTTEFSRHRTRAADHGCNFGVAVSTMGFRLSNGTGISEDVYFLSRTGVYHLLMAVGDLKAVDRGGQPLSVLQKAFVRTTNDAYRTNGEWRDYCENGCASLLRVEQTQRQPAIQQVDNISDS